MRYSYEGIFLSAIIVLSITGIAMFLLDFLGILVFIPYFILTKAIDITVIGGCATVFWRAMRASHVHDICVVCGNSLLGRFHFRVLHMPTLQVVNLCEGCFLEFGIKLNSKGVTVQDRSIFVWRTDDWGPSGLGKILKKMGRWEEKQKKASSEFRNKEDEKNNRRSTKTVPPVLRRGRKRGNVSS